MMETVNVQSYFDKAVIPRIILQMRRLGAQFNFMKDNVLSYRGNIVSRKLDFLKITHLLWPVPDFNPTEYA